MAKPKTTCLLDFCQNEAHAKGFCYRHYYHYSRKQPLVDYSKIEEDSPVDKNGCWITQLEDDNTEERRKSLFNTSLKIDGYPYDVDVVIMKCGNNKCWNFRHLDFDKEECFTINPNYQRND